MQVVTDEQAPQRAGSKAVGKWWLRVALAGLLGLMIGMAGCADDPDDGETPGASDVPSADVPEADSSTEPTLVCTASAQCAGMEGVGVCLEGVCDPIAGECVLFERPNCCLADDECEDGYGGTVDTCVATVCQHAGSTPCQDASECGTDQPCIQAICDGVCITSQTPGCCLVNDDCADGDSCTADLCDATVCANEPSMDPLCCGEVVWTAEFTGSLDDFEVETNGEAAVWHLSIERAHSPGGSMRFADPATGIYGNPLVDGKNPTSFGVARTPEVTLPDTEQVSLTFWVWMDLNEVEVEYDLTYLEIYAPMGAIPQIWNKGEISEEDYGKWKLQTVDVSAWAGQTVRFGFVINTLDGTANKGEGVYVDDMTVTGGCDDAPDCTNDEQCDDGQPCTDDRCDGGLCVTTPNPECCVVDEDCPPPPPVACASVTCEEGQCVFGVVAGCCVSDEECDDGNGCTLDSCDTATTSCISEPIAGCCEELEVLAQNFDSPNGPPGQIDNDNPDVGWRVDGINSWSDPMSLRYGDELGAYGVGVQSSGTYMFPAVNAEPGTSLQVSFRVNASIDSAPGVDRLELRIAYSPDDVVVVWDKSMLPDSAFANWVEVTVDVPKAGSFRAQFAFDTVTADSNDGAGVFVDDFRVHTACGGGCDPAECNDGNPCTIDSCGANGACSYELIEGCGACMNDDDCPDDDNPCTGVSCFQGQCLYIPDPDCNPCSDDIDCEDGDPCTENLCNGGTCVSVNIPNCGMDCATVQDCNDNDDCTADFCQDGLCANVDIPGCLPDCTTNTDCDDGDPCTAGQCQNGECSHLPIPECGCSNNQQCDDGDECTGDFCVEGACQSLVIPGCSGCTNSQQCDDGDPCTNALCIGGQCLTATVPGCCSSATQCADNDACTADFCEQNVCANLPIPGCGCNPANCDDGDPCTNDDCDGNGQCISAPVAGCCSADVECNDGQACTIDACGPNGTCVFTAIVGCCSSNADCNDGNACTSDSCVGGTCTTSPVASCCTAASQCGDGNPCTVDSCTNNQCLNTPTAGQPGCCAVAADCEDGDSCTSHSCLEGVCKTTAVPDCCATDGECDDGLVCTSNVCENGSCKTTQLEGCCFGNASCTDGIACTIDTCDNATGQCQYQVLAGCCFGDADCDDGDPCTADSCASNNFCFKEAIEGCCATDSDCPAAGNCETSKCLANQCFVSDDPGCCQSDGQCDDGDSCTTNTCNNGECSSSVTAGCCQSDSDCLGASCTIGSCNAGVCSFGEDPACCSGGTLLFAAFGSGLGGWTVEGTSDAYWHISTANFQGAPASLWFGNESTGDFSSSQGVSAGRAVSPPATIPSSTVSAVLNFSVWLDVEVAAQFDTLEVFALLENGESVKVWDKTAIPPGSYQQWAAVKVNLSNFAGQTIRIALEFDSTDTVDNAGAGVFVDDMTIIGSCDEVNICTFDGECSDGVTCTSDTCVSGVCTHDEIPDCCTSDAECDDAYECSIDSCGANGQCQFQVLPGCCQFDGECSDGNTCTTDSCQANVCVNNPSVQTGCCASDENCEDGDTCTSESCQNFQCVYVSDEANPQCCDDVAPYSANFDNATTMGMQILSDGGPAFWSVQNKRFFSPPFSLYFGIPGEWQYTTNPPASGQAITPEYDIPAAASTASLSFRVWLDIEQGGFGDSFRVLVLSGNTLKQVWTSGNQPGEPATWRNVFLDMTEYKGKTVKVYFSFQAAEAPFGGGEGIFLDNVALTSSCP